MNPYVFFVGCPRSGTTLVRRLANTHPTLGVIHESRWIVTFWEKRMGLTPDGVVTPKLLDLLPRHKRFKALEIEADDLRRLHAERPHVTYAQFVTAIFDRFGERHGKRVVGDKSPEYALSIPTLHELWPAAKFVHIIRDGRDVCLSVAQWQKGAMRFATSEEDPVATTAVWWERNVRLAREAGARLDRDLYYELRYEALVADPARECARLCAFLGIPYDDVMLRIQEGKARRDPELDENRARQRVMSGLRNWMSEMRSVDVVRFEAAAGELLDELGYTRGAASPSEDELRRTARIREAYVDRAQARGRPVPAAWVRG